MYIVQNRAWTELCDIKRNLRIIVITVSAPGSGPSMASGAPLLSGASAAQSMYPSTQYLSQNQQPQQDVYAQYNIPSNTANVTAAAYAHQMAAAAAAAAAGGTAPYASAATQYSGISAANITDLYTGT